ncbi:hypothetical protein KFE25_010139 [Diacronema lutheri]|mgnify:CR=1 FL=1|uniref:Anaphase-promoting complex subunit 6 n=2 Tax=Diacronema lutheri TaxID=2081491 RepID=A0A8J5XA86_DIALT|nr:hypothetical protein KFE25_010139 [Diacronema lutheri]
MASLDRLRSIVADSLGKHMYANAIFFADKLVSMSNGDPDDVYRLAQAYYYTRQHRRALRLLRAHGLVAASVRACFLAARCLIESQAYDECLTTIARGVALCETDPHARTAAGAAHGADGRLSALASLYLLAGKAHDAQDHRSLAAKSYAQAACEDVFCFEAVDTLVSRRMLSAEQQRSLLAQIVARVPPSEGWLRVYYQARLDEAHALALVARMTSASPPGAPGVALGASAADASNAPAMPAPLGAARAAAPPAAPAPPLYNLEHNAELVSMVAEAQFERGAYGSAFDLSSRVLRADPFEMAAVPVHCCALHQLRRKPELFDIGHRLVEAYPQRAETWFAVGCYYSLIGEYESARRHFSKATALQPTFVPAWIGFAHAFAAQEESDQAMAAYRSATRLFAGSPLPWLGIGMEYLRTNHLPLAEQYLRQAHTLAPDHPLVKHELGVVHFLKGEYEDARDAFIAVADDATAVVPASAAEAREPSLLNLGHTYRRLGQLDKAVSCYQTALSVRPRAASTYAALAFAHHLAGDSHQAIVHYHQALSLRPDDTFTSEMLSRALEEALLPEPLELANLPAQPLPASAAEEVADMEMAA